MQIRPVMVHAQTVKSDHVKRMAELDVIPSYFVAHTYYCGDIHLGNLGPQRAMTISPLKTTVDASVRFTLHQDTPVIMPDMSETLWCVVERVTKEGTRRSKSPLGKP